MLATDPLEDALQKICKMESPLHERLLMFAQAMQEYAPQYTEAYDELIMRCRSAGLGQNAPDVDGEMPDFSLPDGDMNIHNLSDMLQHGPVVISLNRGHWCEFCRVELTALQQGLKKIASQGGQVVSIMPETRQYVAKAAAATGHSFPVLSDENNGYALRLNLVMWIGERVRQLFVAEGLQLDYCQGNASWFVPVPATFVVAPDGRVAARFVDPDFRKRMDIETIVAALQNIKM